MGIIDDNGDVVLPLKNDVWHVETTDGQIGVVPHFHDGQWRAFDSTSRFVLMLAGTQGGKTSFGPLWLWEEIRRRGPGDYLAITATYPLLKLKMLPEFRRLFDHTFKAGTWQAADRVFLFADGQTRVIFGSAQNPESLESATAKAAWLDEAGQDQFRLEAWEAIVRRLSLAQGRALLGTTPYNLGWLKTEIYDRWQAGDRNYDVISFPSITNPAFPVKEYERAKRTMPDWKFGLFYEGRFTRPAGLIYGSYSDSPRSEGGHLVEPFSLPPEWPRYVGIDFGGVNTALVWIAHDPAANVFYLYEESLEGDMSTAEHVARARAKAMGVNARTWYGGAKSEKQQRMDWTQAGIALLEPDVSDVEAGIDRIFALFKTFRLYVFSTCRGVRDELARYSRKLDELGNALSDIKDKDTFHRLDALRYVGQGLSLPPPAQVQVDRPQSGRRLGWAELRQQGPGSVLRSR